MKHKILVVDDEHAVADTLCLIFKKRGFDCRAVYTGDSAIASADEFCPELLVVRYLDAWDERPGSCFQSHEEMP